MFWNQTYVSLYRPSPGAPKGTLLLSNIAVRVDNASLDLVVKVVPVVGHLAVDLFTIVTLDWPSVPIQRGDILVDTLNTDETTNALYRYKVITRPQNFDGQHQEVTAEVVVGG